MRRSRYIPVKSLITRYLGNMVYNSNTLIVVSYQLTWIVVDENLLRLYRKLFEIEDVCSYSDNHTFFIPKINKLDDRKLNFFYGLP